MFLNFHLAFCCWIITRASGHICRFVPNSSMKSSSIAPIFNRGFCWLPVYLRNQAARLLVGFVCRMIKHVSVALIHILSNVRVIFKSTFLCLCQRLPFTHWRAIIVWTGGLQLVPGLTSTYVLPIYTQFSHFALESVLESKRKHADTLLG